MDQSPPHSNKKVIIFVVGAVSLVLIFLFLSYLTINSGSEESSDDPSALVPNSLEEDSESPDNKNDSPASNSSKTYKNEKFSLSYPPDWKVEEFTVAESTDRGVTIRPIVDVSASPSMVVLVGSTTSDPSISEKQQLYVDMGFASSVTQINNIQATNLRGTISPDTDAAGQPGAETINASHIFFDKGDTGYLLKLTYLGQGVNPEFENTFARIISSFKAL